MANIPLLHKVMDHIETHPEEHYQQHWGFRTACGTAYCFAGHAAVMSGWDPLFEDYATTNNDGIRGKFAGWCARGNEVIFIEEAATRELDIDPFTADELFRPGNSRELLRKLVDEIIASER